MGAAVGYPFNLDHGPTMKVKNGCYYRLDVSAGDHIISHDYLLIGKDPQPIHVEPGQTVYFLWTSHLFMGSIFEVAEDQSEAAQRCTQLRAQN
jgi:hypothetical protein